VEAIGMRRRDWIWIALVLALAMGCSSPRVAPPTAVETPPPLVDAATEAPAPDPAAGFMPADDETLTFALNDQTVTEYLLRDGDRFVAVQDGEVYATWFLRDDGLWRPDPKGGGALLRYLPPVLADGLTWKQHSGDAEVWFSLRRGNTDLGTNITAADGWILTVINRAERLELTFALGIGPAMARSENWAVRADSYTKRAVKVTAGGPEADRRRAFLAKAAAAPPAPAQVVPVSPEGFTAAAQAAMLAAQPDIKAIDLTGDGQPEYLRGPLGDWTTEPVEIFRSDAVVATTFEPWEPNQLHRVRPVTFAGDKRTWFIHELQVGSDRHSMIMAHAALGEVLYGWGPKASLTEGSRIEATPDGRFTVWWDHGDPARHRWIREYRLDPSAGAALPYLQRLSSRLEPAAGALRYPTEPREVLHAAFIAGWFRLESELPRYFAAPEAAAALAKLPEAMYRPGTVEIGALTLEDLSYGATVIKRPKLVPSPVGADGSAAFLAILGSYETSIYTWGTVTFSPGGLIQSLVIEGTSEIM
jgi:hypothetical protein